MNLHHLVDLLYTIHVEMTFAKFCQAFESALASAQWLTSLDLCGVYIHVCVYVCRCIHIYVYVSIFTYIYVYVSTNVYICIHIYVYKYRHIFIYIHSYTCNIYI